MEQVDYRCPHCAAVVKAPPSLEGESGECPKCKADVERWPAPISQPRPLVPQPPAAPQPSRQETVWYYMMGDKRRGPVTQAQLKALVESGSLRPTDLVWRDGMPGWVAASWLPGLFPPLPASQPPAVVPLSQPPVPVARAAPRDTQECPYCCEVISVRAKRCPVCGETVDVAMREAEEARREAEDARREARRRPRPRRDREVVYYHNRQTCPHALHLVLTILTLGLWLPIWIIHWVVVECS